MPESTPWRELYRSSDSKELLAVVTCIAAMEFERRCVDPSGQPIDVSELAQVSGPVVVQVREEDHASLLEVLHEIIAEQEEFDALCERGGRWTWKRALVSLAALIGVAIILLMTLMPR